MANKKRQNPNYHCEGVVHKVFKGLRWNSDVSQILIKSFKRVKNDTGVYQINIELFNNLILKFYFFHSKNFKGECSVLREHAREVHFVLGPGVEQDLIKKKIEQQIILKSHGLVCEQTFLLDIKNCQFKNIFIHEDIIKSNSNDDILGVDMWFPFETKIDTKMVKFVMPIQIKSDTKKLHEHAIKFPEVPSIYYFPNAYSIKELSKCIEFMALDYARGNVVNLASINEVKKRAESVK